MSFLKWNNAEPLPPVTYSCGHCGNHLASSQGFATSTDSVIRAQHRVYICTMCCRPTYIQPDGTQSPSPPFGQEVKFLPSAAFESLYNEARIALSAGAYTACTLCCRKLVMFVAVSRGAPPGLMFLEYLDYLNGDGFVPPDAQQWVESITQRGNEADHEVSIMTRQDAENLMIFVEALLKFLYEFPGMLKQRRHRPSGI